MQAQSVAQSLAGFVCEQLGNPNTAAGSARVSRVRVRVGTMCGAQPQALKIAYVEAVVGTPLQGSTLEIESLDLVAWCPRCHQEQLIPDPSRLRCPACGSRTPRIVQGNELEITAIETIDDDAVA